MTQAPPRPAAPDTPRRRLRRRRLAVARAALPVALALAGVGALLAVPHGLAAIRLLGVAFGWWAALAGFGALVVALALRPPARR